MQKLDIKLYLFYVLFFFTAITYAGKKINKDKVILNSVPSISINLDTIVYFNTAVLFDLDLKDTVKKVFKSKNGAGLQNYKSIKITDSASVVNSATADAFQYEFYENAITVLSNINAIIPIKKLEQQKIAYVKIGNADNEAFISTLQKYADVTVIEDANTDRLQRKLARYTTVIIGYHKIDNVFENYGFTSDEIAKIKFLSGNNNVILNVFANPYCLSAIDSFENIKGLIVSYQNKTVAQIVSAELIFGAIQAKGKLPFSIKPYFKGNEGLSTEKLDRLGFTYAENVGMDAAVLSKIDVIANKAITEKMTPGIQVLVARKGKVIYQKSFGYHTYENIIKVQNSDIYDVASLTKIMATLPNVMLQYDRKKINLETNLGEMLPNFIGSNKEKINLKDLLSHYAGLVAGPSFSNAALNSSKGLSEVYFRKKAEINFTKQLADSLFIRNDFSDIMMQMIINSKLSVKKEYRYSDLTFMILKDYLEKSTAKTLDVLIQDNFYKSLGMNNSGYNPVKNFAKNRIPPTESDTYFRRQLLQGYVNDLSAALEGGVSGHAGIFSNAMDVAKLMQLYLQKGSYGNQYYFSEKTFEDFNTCYFCAEGNRRGVGFDKPQLGKDGPTCGCASMTSFGHTGYTGTMAWADPENQIVYIFLSNRTYPVAKVNRLSKANIREDIQKVIYDAIVQ